MKLSHYFNNFFSSAAVSAISSTSPTPPDRDQEDSRHQLAFYWLITDSQLQTPFFIFYWRRQGNFLSLSEFQGGPCWLRLTSAQTCFLLLRGHLAIPADPTWITHLPGPPLHSRYRFPPASGLVGLWCSLFSSLLLHAPSVLMSPSPPSSPLSRF